MDPLSITTAILTLTALISTSLKTAQALSESSREVRELGNEVVDLGLVIRETAKTLQTETSGGLSDDDKIPTLDSDREDSITVLLTRCKGKLLELEALLGRFVGGGKPGLTNGRLGAKAKIIWVKEKGKLDSIRQQLNAIKLSLVGVLQARNSVNISRIHLRLEGVEITKSALSVKHRENLDQGSELTVINKHQPGQEILDQLLHARGGSAVLLQASLSGCSKWCSCLCHRTSRLKSPRLLNDLLGALSVNYTGLPYISDPCNEKKCKPRTSASARVTYQFPSWLLSRALTVLVDANKLNGPELQLRTLRVVPASSAIFRLALAGDIQGMQALFRQGAASIYDIDGTRWSILHKAFINNQLGVCKFLLEQGADATIEATNGTSVVERAWYFERTKTGFGDSGADLLFDVLKEADVESLVEMQQYTIIHKIVLGLGTLDLSSQLEHSTAMIDAVDTRGRTALWWAATRGNSEAVRTLLEYGASIKNPSGPNNHSALHVAQNADCVRALLDFGAEIDCRDEQGRTPLHACAYRGTVRGGSVELLEFLLDSGADVHARTIAGHTPLHYAAQFGWLEHTKLLIDRGADINAEKATGRTPLMEIVGCSHMGSSRFVDIARFLVDKGAKIRTLNKHRRSILHLAAERADARMLRGLADIMRSKSNRDSLDADATDLFGLRPSDILDQRICEMVSSTSAEAEELRSAFGLLLEASLSCQSDEEEQGAHDVGSYDSTNGRHEDGSSGMESEEEDTFEDAQAYSTPTVDD